MNNRKSKQLASILTPSVVRALAGKINGYSEGDRLCVLFSRRRYNFNSTLNMDIADRVINIYGNIGFIRKNIFTRALMEKMHKPKRKNGDYGNRFIITSTTPVTLVEAYSRSVIRVWTFENIKAGGVFAELVNDLVVVSGNNLVHYNVIKG